MSDTITTHAKKWGHSISVIVDSEIVKKQGILPKDELIISVQKIDTIRALRGTFPKKRPTQEIVDESKRGWQ